MASPRGVGQGETFTRRVLGPGLTLHMLRTPKFKTVSIRVAVRRNLTVDEVAANACIPFVLRRGTRRHPDTRSIARFLEDLYGTQLAVDSSKVGETQVLEFALESVADRYVSSSVELVREGLRFLGELLLQPRQEGAGFRPSFVAQEVEMLRRRIEGIINDKPVYALERLRQTMCADEPFGLHRYGTIEALEAVDAVGLYRHYERVVRESPIDVFVVGDISPDQVEAWVREAMPVPRGPIQTMKPLRSRLPEAVREVEEFEDVHQGILAIGYRTPLRFPDDGYEQLLMYNGILGGFPHSKLFLNVRERASLAYFTASRLDGTKGIMVTFAGIDPDKYDEARGIMERQVEDMAAGRMTDDEMHATREALVSSLRTVSDSADRLIGHELLCVVNGRFRRPEETAAALEKVTRGQLVELAAKIAPDTVYFLTRAQPVVEAAGEAKGEGEGR